MGLLDGQSRSLRGFLRVQPSRGVGTLGVHFTASEQRSGLSPYTATWISQSSFLTCLNDRLALTPTNPLVV